MGESKRQQRHRHQHSRPHHGHGRAQSADRREGTHERWTSSYVIALRRLGDRDRVLAPGLLAAELQAIGITVKHDAGIGGDAGAIDTIRYVHQRRIRADGYLHRVGVPDLEAALTSGNKEYRLITYPGTRHAFFNDTGTRHNPEASAEAWAETLAWFDQHLKS